MNINPSRSFRIGARIRRQRRPMPRAGSETSRIKRHLAGLGERPIALARPRRDRSGRSRAGAARPRAPRRPAAGLPGRDAGQRDDLGVGREVVAVHADLGERSGSGGGRGLLRRGTHGRDGRSRQQHEARMAHVNAPAAYTTGSAPSPRPVDSRRTRGRSWRRSSRWPASRYACTPMRRGSHTRPKYWPMAIDALMSPTRTSHRARHEVEVGVLEGVLRRSGARRDRPTA